MRRRCYRAPWQSVARGFVAAVLATCGVSGCQPRRVTLAAVHGARSRRQVREFLEDHKRALRDPANAAIVWQGIRHHDLYTQALWLAEIGYEPPIPITAEGRATLTWIVKDFVDNRAATCWPWDQEAALSTLSLTGVCTEPIALAYRAPQELDAAFDHEVARVVDLCAAAPGGERLKLAAWAATYLAVKGIRSPEGFVKKIIAYRKRNWRCRKFVDILKRSLKEAPTTPGESPRRDSRSAPDPSTQPNGDAPR